ncbi:transporter suffix domain-containing protein [Rhizobiaceae bacterium n13]|uniref:Transporter suffix domain-containing protein n=1 Tax=Ferirhizobium litorale TaxID=2927786 RepID=A0AAE3QDL3_9HYPH|nr:transporter suffix domain-containing protein [Fererhizobium litorale]MDI7863137.1 transporter suffix domain-containing protein [Fererhizobium litorale]MDI7923185.1 transporter suffix domain-containing protein [Fererhizobium litorale]
MNTQSDPDGRGANRDWRFRCGVALFALMIAKILAMPLMALSSMPPARAAAISGAIFVTNKFLLLLIVAVMGKEGFQELKRILGSYLPALKRDGPVGPTRHLIGVVMFCLPILSAILSPYVDYFWPGLMPGGWILQIAGDLMLIASFFVLGGNFWDKVHALFIRNARVVDVTDHSP